MNKISNTELFTVMISLFTFLFPMIGTFTILKEGNTSSLSVLILGFIFSIIPVLLIMFIGKRCKNKNIFQFNRDNFGLFGYILNFLYFIGIIFMFIVIAWTTLNFTINQLLIRNSYYTIAFIYSTILVIAVCKGKEIICRTSLILYIIFFLSVVISFSLLIPKINLENVLPIISIKPQKIFNLALLIPGYFAYPLVTLLCIKRNDIRNNNKTNKTIALAFIISSFIVFMFYFFIISTYGIELASLYVFPEYNLFKEIDVLDFIQRVENIMASTFFISAFSGVCMIIYFLKLYFKDLFKMKNKVKINATTFVIAIIVPFLSIYLFSNYNLQFLMEKYSIFSSIILITLIINFIFIKIKRVNKN